MIVNHNISALTATRNLSINNAAGDRSLESLSSGMRVNRGADDAAGLAVTEKMRAQIRGFRQAHRNVQDGVSLLQTAEGHLQGTSAALQRVRELAVQAANNTYTNEDRAQIQTEVSQLLDEVERVAVSSEFNRKTLFTGTYASSTELNDQSRPTPAGSPDDPAAPAGDGSGIRLQIGPNMDQEVRVYLGDQTLNGLGIQVSGASQPVDGAADVGSGNVDVTSVDGANRSIGVVDAALTRVNKQRTDLGAMQNRLETAANGIDIAAENLQAAESRIRDTDMAGAMVEFMRNSILSQTSVSMIAQANMRPQMVLRLLGS